MDEIEAGGEHVLDIGPQADHRIELIDPAGIDQVERILIAEIEHDILAQPRADQPRKTYNHRLAEAISHEALEPQPVAAIGGKRGFVRRRRLVRAATVSKDIHGANQHERPDLQRIEVRGQRLNARDVRLGIPLCDPFLRRYTGTDEYIERLASDAFDV